MQKTNKRIIVGFSGLFLITSAASAVGQTSPGARPGDKEMACQDVAKEQAKINGDIQKRAGRKAAGKKLGKGLFGFAKNLAAATVPSTVSGLGGSSVLGGAVGRAASQEVGGAIYDAGRTVGNGAQPAKSAAKPEEQARLDRLSKIGAYRQCPASSV